MTDRITLLRATGLGALIGALVIALLLGTAAVSSVLPVNRPTPKETTSVGALQEGRKAQRPNVLLIITDDQAIGSMNVMKKTRKYFQRQGRTFSDAYATTPSCCPARASIYTGQYVHNHHVWRNTDGVENLDHSTTMQHALKRNGYRTALFGKYLNAFPLRRDPPKFDEFATFMGKGGGSGDTVDDSYFGRPWNINGKIKKIDTHSTDYVRFLSRRFIKQRDAINDRQPWMMAVTPFAPHAPATPTRRHKNTPVPRWEPGPDDRERDRSDKPAYVRRDKRSSFAITRDKWRLQLRSLLTADEMVAGIMRKLEKTNELENTIAFFISDNGRMFGSHGLGGKGVPYTESVKVPFFMRWPGTVEPGSVDRRLVGNIDIAPTIYGALGIEPPTTVDGRDLLDESWDRDRIHTEMFGSKSRVELRWGSTITPDYQYTEYISESSDSPEERELYDMVEDPWQLQNLLGDDDPDNDPGPIQLFLYAYQVRSDRECAGFASPNPCP